MKRRTAAAIAGAMLLGLVAFPGGAAATSNEPIAQTGGMEATLPLLGASLTVGVTLDATGNISGVTLNPSGTLAQTSSSASLVTFSNADGSATLKARAGGSKLTIAARTKTLAGLSGTGSWKADVFGTGAKSTVAYTVGDDGSGNPTLAIGAVSAAAGITATVDAPKTTKGKRSAVAAGGVTFAYSGFVKHLRIAVTVKLADSTAGLKITLSGKDRQKLSGTLAALAGARSWSAHLCDGTGVGVTYHLTAAGDLVFDGATGAAFTEKDWPGDNGAKAGKGAAGWHHGWFWGGRKVEKAKGTIVDGFVVRFDKTRVGFAAVLVKMADGSYAVLAQGSSGKCGTPKGGHHDSSKGGTSDAGRHDGDRRGPPAGWSGGHGGSHGG